MEWHPCSTPLLGFFVIPEENLRLPLSLPALCVGIAAVI
jgi:hypothetical protein